MTSIPRHGLRPALKGPGHGLGQVPGLCHASVSPSGKKVKLLGLIRENWAFGGGQGAVPSRGKRREVLMVQRQPVAKGSRAGVSR